MNLWLFLVIPISNVHIFPWTNFNKKNKNYARIFMNINVWDQCNRFMVFFDNNNRFISNISSLFKKFNIYNFFTFLSQDPPIFYIILEVDFCFFRLISLIFLMIYEDFVNLKLWASSTRFCESPSTSPK